MYILKEIAYYMYASIISFGTCTYTLQQLRLCIIHIICYYCLITCQTCQVYSYICYRLAMHLFHMYCAVTTNYYENLPFVSDIKAKHALVRAEKIRCGTFLHVLHKHSLAGLHGVVN